MCQKKGFDLHGRIDYLLTRLKKAESERDERYTNAATSVIREEQERHAAELAKANARLEVAVDLASELAEAIVQWSESYPVSVFGDPTPEQVDSVCKSLGFRIDTIAAMVLREFTKNWGNRGREALAKLRSME
jgi:hypothetical protein